MSSLTDEGLIGSKIVGMVAAWPSSEEALGVFFPASCFLAAVSNREAVRCAAGCRAGVVLLTVLELFRFCRLLELLK